MITGTRGLITGCHGISRGVMGISCYVIHDLVLYILAILKHGDAGRVSQGFLLNEYQETNLSLTLLLKGEVSYVTAAPGPVLPKAMALSVREYGQVLISNSGYSANGDVSILLYHLDFYGFGIWGEVPLAAMSTRVHGRVNGGVNDGHGMDMLSMAVLYTDLHPLEALVITKFRESRYEIDKLRGVYGMIDERWHVIEETDFERAWEATTIKYITDRPAGEHPDLAPLVTISVTKDLKTTWCQRIRTYGKKISSYSTAACGDDPLPQVNGDIPANLSLLTRAVHHAKRHVVLNGPPKTVEELEELTQYTSDANAVSSGLREILSGWDRWIVFCTNGP
ncbi:hypothetical protein K435DRAFT_802703 [Dendrothele bispora CBS 962.96]|uniref:Uncharacterized protein n=1 Tax=Dendrothele bispora (strain CBS 962.96) TaxID=1314807 RepID=A0A4S8LK01_DENBC|nr:hypothetical protein K435DRAFT_802703 [Dendrothele bispora CBS 962.96]